MEGQSLNQATRPPGKACSVCFSSALFPSSVEEQWRPLRADLYPLDAWAVGLQLCLQGQTGHATLQQLDRPEGNQEPSDHPATLSEARPPTPLLCFHLSMISIQGEIGSELPLRLQGGGAMCVQNTPGQGPPHGRAEQRALWAGGRTMCSFLRFSRDYCSPNSPGPRASEAGDRLHRAQAPRELVTDCPSHRAPPSTFLFLTLTVLPLSPQSVPRVLFSDLVLWRYHHLVFYQGWKPISKITFFFFL